MVSCKSCTSLNSLDSTFCRRCGAALVAEDVDAARAKLKSLIEDGNSAYNEGKIDEALEVSETALLSDPTSVAALALKMNCLERRDRIAEALECAERIVELNPDSELDKIKRNQLRRQLEMTARELVPSGRNWAILGAASAFILMLTVGSFAALAMRKSQERALQASNTKLKVETPSVVQNPVTTQNPTPNPNPGVGTQPNQSTPQPNVQQQNLAPNPRENTAVPSKFPPTGDGDQLPVPQGNGMSVRPITPTGPIGNPTAANPTNTNSSTNPSPTKKPGGNADGDPVPDKNDKVEEQKPVGSMEITLHNGSSAPVSAGNGGSIRPSTGESDGNGLQALLKTASQHYQTQNYGSAASAYERAIQAGADATVYCERLGQSYEHSNRKSDAVNAYNRGLKACEAAIASGKGDKEKLERLADRYRTHLRVTAG